MTAPESLLESRAGDTVELTLNRPERRNALDRALVDLLADRLMALAEEEVRCVVLAGGPPTFCAGGDLADLGASAAEGAAAVTDVVYRKFHRLVAAIEGAPFPLVAAVDGAAMGAGLDLALTCDLRVATTRSVFASSWIEVGLVPGMGGAQLATQAAGSARAAELVLLGQPISAEVARDWGLINRVCPPEELAETVDGIVQRLVSLPRTAISRSKASLRRASGIGLAAELATMGAVQGALLTSPDFAARTERFRRATPG